MVNIKEKQEQLSKFIQTYYFCTIRSLADQQVYSLKMLRIVFLLSLKRKDLKKEHKGIKTLIQKCQKIKDIKTKEKTDLNEKTNMFTLLDNTVEL